MKGETKNGMQDKSGSGLAITKKSVGLDTSNDGKSEKKVSRPPARQKIKKLVDKLKKLCYNKYVR